MAVQLLLDLLTGNLALVNIATKTINGVLQAENGDFFLMEDGSFLATET